MDPTNAPEPGLTLAEAAAQAVEISKRGSLKAALLLIARPVLPKDPRTASTIEGMLDLAYMRSPDRDNPHNANPDAIDKAMSVVTDALLRVGYFAPEK